MVLLILVKKIPVVNYDSEQLHQQVPAHSPPQKKPQILSPIVDKHL